MKLYQVLINLVSQFKLKLTKLVSNGKEINLTADNTIIKSTNFNVDKNGNMTCENANISGTISSSNATITGGKIKVSGSGSATDLLRVEQSSNSRIFSYMQPTGAGFVNGGTDNAVYITSGSISGIDIYDNNGTTTLNGSGITTPKLTQTSLESIKKNISIYNENALQTILNSDIYSYNLKSEKDTDNKHIGFVIGDKYRTPKQLMNNEQNGIELYSAIGILWKGMQEQQNIIEKLENRIKEMEEKINE